MHTKLVRVINWILAPLVLLVAVMRPPLAFAQTPGSITGQIVNGTPEGKVPSALQVTLHIFDKAGGAKEATSTSDDKGTFRFDGIPTTSGSSYIISTNYTGVTYTREVNPPFPSAPILLTIYDTSSEIETLQITHNTLLIGAVDKDNRKVFLLESVELENKGDRTFVPDQSKGPMNLLRFSLPSNFAELKLSSPTLRGGDLISVDKGFALTTPVPPGSHEVLFSYTVSYQGSSFQFIRSFSRGAGVFRLLVPFELKDIEAPGTKELEPALIGSNKYRLFQAEKLERSSSLNIKLKNMPQPAFVARINEILTGSPYPKLALVTALAAALFAAALNALLARRSLSALPASGGTLQMRVTPQRDHWSLVEAIGRLDDRFERGEIEKEEYQSQRGRLKAFLLSLEVQKEIENSAK